MISAFIRPINCSRKNFCHIHSPRISLSTETSNHELDTIASWIYKWIPAVGHPTSKKWEMWHLYTYFSQYVTWCSNVFRVFSWGILEWRFSSPGSTLLPINQPIVSITQVCTQKPFLKDNLAENDVFHIAHRGISRTLEIVQKKLCKVYA